MHAPTPDDLVSEQISYYRARAAEYDRMLEREGRYTPDGLDPESPDPDTRELAAIEQRLRRFAVEGPVLELACGSGFWTPRLARLATPVTAVDASAEMIALNRRRVAGLDVNFVEADIFSWRPAQRFSTVFFAFWLSHVPIDRLAEFWGVVAACCAPGGRVFFIDEMAWDAADAHEAPLGDERGTTVRALEDGTRYRMVKVYHRPRDLESLLEGLGWEARVEPAGRRLFAGTAAAASDPQSTLKR